MTALRVAFTEPRFNRFVLLLVGAVLARDRRTVNSLLWLMCEWVDGHLTTYHVFSRSAWALWPLAKVLATFVVALAEQHGQGESILVTGDHTVAQAKGERVSGMGCPHDAGRSSHRHLVWRWGHRWVVLALLVPFPWARPPWALPVWVALYRSQELNGCEGGRPHYPP